MLHLVNEEILQAAAELSIYYRFYLQNKDTFVEIRFRLSIINFIIYVQFDWMKFKKNNCLQNFPKCMYMFKYILHKLTDNNNNQ